MHRICRRDGLYGAPFYYILSMVILLYNYRFLSCFFFVSFSSFFFESIPQYLLRATQAMRSALREPAKSRAVKRDEYGYTKQVWEDGTPGKKVRVGISK
jgi:hypothetical protein